MKIALIAGMALAGAAATSVVAQEAPAPTAPATAPDVPAGAPPAVAATAPTLGPSLSGPLVANANPISFDIPAIGKIYVSGVGSGIARFQDHSVPGDHSSYGDLSNAQVIVQKVDGVFQFYAQAGIYSLPSLGTGYLRATRATDATYSPLPEAFIKIAPNAAFSIEVGKLPTLIGAEYTFTFENMNIDRGLLWNQEPAISKGVQANYTHGPIALSLSLNDGYYSSKYSTLSGSATYTFNPANVLAFVASGNTKRTYKSTFSTPGILNNSELYNLIYTYTKGKVIVQPYVQYSHVSAQPFFGTTAASTIGGAILAKYSFTPEFSLPVRAEYISSSGRSSATAANLLYGSGSDAYSLTFTPTYQYKVLFARAELSYVKATGATPGAVFGTNGLDRSQTRGLLEVGIMF